MRDTSSQRRQGCCLRHLAGTPLSWWCSREGDRVSGIRLLSASVTGGKGDLLWVSRSSFKIPDGNRQKESLWREESPAGDKEESVTQWPQRSLHTKNPAAWGPLPQPEDRAPPVTLPSGLRFKCSAFLSKVSPSPCGPKRTQPGGTWAAVPRGVLCPAGSADNRTSSAAPRCCSARPAPLPTASAPAPSPSPGLCIPIPNPQDTAQAAQRANSPSSPSSWALAETNRPSKTVSRRRGLARSQCAISSQCETCGSCWEREVTLRFLEHHEAGLGSLCWAGAASANPLPSTSSSTVWENFFQAMQL